MSPRGDQPVGLAAVTGKHRSQFGCRTGGVVSGGEADLLSNGKASVTAGDQVTELVRVDCSFIHIEQRHVIVQDEMQEDQKLDEIGIGLLPEGLLTVAIKIVHEAREAVGERVGVEIGLK